MNEAPPSPSTEKEEVVEHILLTQDGAVAFVGNKIDNGPVMESGHFLHDVKVEDGHYVPLKEEMVQPDMVPFLRAARSGYKDHIEALAKGGVVRVEGVAANRVKAWVDKTLRAEDIKVA